MAHLTPAPAPAPALSPDVAHILDDVFTLCRIPFVHDFIFTADAVADISILTAPVQTEHSIAARITVSGTESSARFAHVFDFSCDFYFCSVPAFSIGPVTVGFCTQEPARDPSHAALHELPLGAGRVQCNRYVRDDHKGVFLMLAENPASGLTELDCMSHRSSRNRTRVCARFRTDALRRALRTPRGVLHPHDIAPSLTYLSVARERRKCPLCAASDHAECGCVLPFKRPMHPLDFRNERRNMSLHTGRYHGGSTVRLFDATHPFIVTSLATRSIIKGSVDKNVISRLNKYAVQDRLAKLKVNPFAWMLPGAAVMPCLPGVGGNEQEIGGILTEIGNGPLSADPAALSSFPESLMKDVIGAGSHASVQKNADAVTANSGMALLGMPSEGTPSPQQSVSQPQGVTTAESFPFNAYGQQPPGISPAASELVADSATADPTDERISRVTAPAKTIKKKTPSSSSDDHIKFADMTEKERKAELRRQRNREAAAKSNVKRKIRNEALRRDLAEVNRRAAELRAVEKMLREENVRLRSRATQQRLNVSSHLTHIQIANS